MKIKSIKTILGAALILGALVGCKDNENGTTPTPVVTPCENHSWDEGKITTEPTDTTDGIKTFTCTVCKTTKTEIVPKSTVSVCEHTWNDGEVTTQPTQTTDGVKTFTCTKCGQTKTEKVDKLPAEEKYRITYDANGGTGTPVVDLTEYSKGERAIVKANTFTAPEGKEFINWNEEPDGSGSYHNVNTSMRVLDNVTLYAQWLDIEDPIGPVDENHEFKIKVSVPEGITYTLSQTQAKKDTEVTLRLTLSEGISLNGDPTSSQTTLDKQSNNVYNFVMPQSDVTIFVRATIDGDVVITGDISAKLTDPDNDGVYTVDVACDDKTTYDFTYLVKDDNGEAKRLSSLKLDETRSNAAVTFVSSGNNQLRVAGGYTYTFYYDSNTPDYSCYVKRKSVDVLPMNERTLYSLFDGRMRSQTTVHPDGLTSIEYTKNVDGNDTEQNYKITNEEYKYSKISNSESFAVSTDKLNGNAKSYVYKKIDVVNNIYSVVNTYTKDQGNNELDDGIWAVDPYGDNHDDGKRYLPYSARQDIVADNMYNETSRYQITSREAKRNINMAAHYSAALEYEIWQSLRGDFSGSATINAANAEGSSVSIVSTPLSGGFQVDINSQLEYNHEESGSTSDVTQQFAFIYSVEMIFKANGDLYSLDYVEKYYTKSDWDFAIHAPKANVKGITTKITANYHYNQTFDRDIVLDGFNPDDYFISSIDKLSFYNSVAGAKENNVSVMNYDDSLDIIPYLGGGKKNSVVDEFTFTPATALDAWQYGYINSSDKGVADNTPWGPKTVGVGDATVTFGNHLVNMAGPTKDVNITVRANGTFASLYADCTVAGYDSYMCDNADYIYGYAGKTMTFYIDSSANTGCPISYYLVIKAKDEFGENYYTDTSEYFNVLNSVGKVHDSKRNLDYDKVVGHELKLDFNTNAANALTHSVTIDVIFASNYYTSGRDPKTMHIVVGPAQASLAGTKYKTTIPYAEPNQNKKYEDAYVEFFNGGTGKITENLYDLDGSLRCTNVFNFSYTELNNGTINASVTSVVIGESGMPTTARSYTLVMERKQSGVLGVALYTDDEVLFGVVTEDGDGYVEVEGLTGFEKVDA